MKDDKTSNHDAAFALEIANRLRAALEEKRAELYAEYSDEEDRAIVDELFEKTLGGVIAGMIKAANEKDAQ
jgi:hypothetical protein